MLSSANLTFVVLVIGKQSNRYILFIEFVVYAQILMNVLASPSMSVVNCVPTLPEVTYAAVTLVLPRTEARAQVLVR